MKKSNSGFSGTMKNIAFPAISIISISLFVVLYSYININDDRTYWDIFSRIFIAEVALVSAIVGWFFWYKEYKKTQSWKKQEFLSNQIKEFFNDYYVDKGLIMIDWNYYYFTDLKDIKSLRFDKELLLSSLEYHKDRKNKGKEFSKEEQRIREIFDKLFYKLGIFYCNIENGLYTYKDLKPYISYYLEIIGTMENDRKDHDERIRIWEYLYNYNFKSTMALLDNAGFDIEKNLKSEDKKLLSDYTIFSQTHTLSLLQRVTHGLALVKQK